jgi:hypothetical protein
MPTVERLSTRALNRALLARQLLLRRQDRRPLEVIEHLVGLQAQEPRDPYLALWSRLDPFDPAEVEQLLESRAVARAPLMRTTIHLATARDCLAIRPLVQPILDRAQRSNFARRLAGADVDALAAAGQRILEQRPRTFAELRAHLGEDWAGYDAQAVAYSVSYLVPLVQLPPRGLWRRGGQATWTTAERWLGRLPKRDAASLDELVRRYLAAFGPATARDVQTWCGLTGLAEVIDRLRPDLVTFGDENGAELVDLPDAPRPDPDTPAPVRFLPQYDNVFLSHADRSRIVSEQTRGRAQAPNGRVSTLLVDGFIAALWRLERSRRAAVLRVLPLERWSKRTRATVEDEAARFLAFAAADAETRDLEFVTAF